MFIIHVEVRLRRLSENIWHQMYLKVIPQEQNTKLCQSLIVLLALYFIVKCAVKKGIEEAYMDITWKVTAEDIEAEKICNKFGLNEDVYIYCAYGESISIKSIEISII